MNMFFIISEGTCVCQNTNCNRPCCGQFNSSSNSYNGNGQNCWQNFAYNIEEQCYHKLSGISQQGEISFSDGTLWEVNPYDMFKLRWWKKNDIIVVRKNRIGVNDYQYKLCNITFGNKVEVNLVHFVDHSQHLKVVFIEGLCVILSDGSSWKTSNDVAWNIGDIIIVGLNNPCQQSAYQYILINANIYKCKPCIPSGRG